MEHPPARSTFVTIVAWTFIGLAGFATFMMLVQSVVSVSVFKTQAFEHLLRTMPRPSPVSQFMFAHYTGFALLGLTLASATLIAAIGLLKRRAWARRLFMVMLGIGVAWQLAAIVLQHYTMASMQTQFDAMPNMPDMHAFVTVIYVFTILQGLAIAGVFAWILVRLRSARIRAEFAP
ncbi:hypothetical protein [Oleiagrimonas soli]|uniref:DUF4149 domain-containing protein n=1 Tax=Oleiagrimonas soli TaxID=1543381 RepID=A0A841KI63_9GAMM|nr:hypothetical protein [Oleiagrimonas soli]MBB6184866.1 hypothetical protein [Oleiagrimonas soli]